MAVNNDEIGDLIYANSIEAHSTVLRRLDAADSRLQSILSVSTGATFSMPIIIKLMAPGADYSLCWPISIGLLFFLTILIGAKPWSQVKVKIVDPTALTKWAVGTPEEFKKEFVRKVGRQLKDNNDLVIERIHCVRNVVLILSVEIAIFGLWVLSLL